MLLSESIVAKLKFGSGHLSQFIILKTAVESTASV
jgi:hypothetical protein